MRFVTRNVWLVECLRHSSTSTYIHVYTPLDIHSCIRRTICFFFQKKKCDSWLEMCDWSNVYDNLQIFRYMHIQYIHKYIHTFYRTMWFWTWDHIYNLWYSCVIWDIHVLFPIFMCYFQTLDRRYNLWYSCVICDIHVLFPIFICFRTWNRRYILWYSCAISGIHVLFSILGSQM